MKEYGLFINGQWESAKGGKTAPSINPATEEAWCNVAVADREDAQKAVAAAKAAHDSGVWRNKSPQERGEIMQRVAAAMFERQDELAAAEVQDGGGTMRKAMSMDVPGAAQTFFHFGSYITGDEYKSMLQEEYDEVVPIPSRNLVVREPIGVTAGITPWNFPMIMGAWKIAPSIAAGNCCVIKPASVTPVSTLLLAEICTQAGVPAGVVNVISGPGGTAGEELATHPDVGKVAFTGSTEVGRRIMQLGAGTLKKVTLELGGKSPNIILPDANIDTAALGSLFATFMHQGQICESGTRILVHESVHDEFMEKMLAGMGRIKIGDTMDPTTGMGPLVSKSQRETVEKYVALGNEQGAKCVAGGKRPEAMAKGYYYEPTVFDDVDNKMRIAQEEIFGPVVSVIRFKDEDEAVRIANDSVYGLGGAVWSENTDRAIALARRIETGTVWINDYHMINLRFPFGGYKQSGVGRELGKWGLAEYHEMKHIHVGESTGPEGKFYFQMLLN
ncbi:MAG TPA: aldehyde dehydrogenase family protein [Candidatus Limnocylindrales bacterium]|nr:aldehyde dehydrogenase family protein [Candidatus Limnocylindrales bacterium]